MAIETLTVTLGVDDSGGKVKGTNLTAGDENDNQIVTVEDGGNLSGTYLFEKWGKGSPTEGGAGPGGDDRFFFDLSLFDDDFTITVKSMDAQDIFQFDSFTDVTIAGTLTTFQYIGSDGQPHTVSIDAESTNGTGTVQVTRGDGTSGGVVILCFARGTRILTDTGNIAIEDLEAGDLVLCSDGEARPIRWVGSSKVDSAKLAAHRNLHPIRFAPDSIEPGQPSEYLSLSPQHKVLIRDWRAELLFGETEVLVPAHLLVNDHSILRDTDCHEVEYFHIALDSHQTIFANGLECETLMPGEMAKTAMSAEARSEIMQLFPELAADLSSYGELVRMSISRYQTDVLMALRSEQV